MSVGRVHTWARDRNAPLGGHVVTRVAPLQHLDASGGLSGRYVRVRNAGWLNGPPACGSGVVPTPLGDARGDAYGDFLFDHGRGGPRLDQYTLRSEKYRCRYLDAARFGEVNTYFHIDRIASYVHELLDELGESSLPPVVAVVHAHHAAVVRNGVRDGEWRRSRWVPFEGGHYRLPSAHNSLREFDPVAADGEIHLGPGWHLLGHGALAEAVGSHYRHNVSHNAGVIYHEYGHHLTRHTADFSGNVLRARDRQRNIKTAIDEGYCDYWAATMLDVPHIWVWHRSHREQPAHPRSLTSAKTAHDFDPARDADPHANGTIWAATLWDLRSRLVAEMDHGARLADTLVLRSLLNLGREVEVAARTSFAVGLAAMLQADEALYSGEHRDAIVDTFRQRGIVLDPGPRCADPVAPGELRQSR